MYKIDVEKIVKKIEASRAKRVLLQLPDGLKPQAVKLASELKERTGAEIIVWAGSNFGGCDIPTHVEREGIDLIVNVGHCPFFFRPEENQRFSLAKKNQGFFSGKKKV